MDVLEAQKKQKDRDKHVTKLNKFGVHEELDINVVFEKHHLTRINRFSFDVGDCLFDFLQMILHKICTSIELRQGTIQHFRFFLQNNYNGALLSYRNELNTYPLMEMHNVDDPEVYLQHISQFSSLEHPLNERGLLGDIFCTYCLLKWLNIPIRIWSKMQKRPYLHFNSFVGMHTYDI